MEQITFDDTNSTFLWGCALIIIVLILLGLFYYMGYRPTLCPKCIEYAPTNVSKVINPESIFST